SVSSAFLSFFFLVPATPALYTLSLHDALPISFLLVTALLWFFVRKPFSLLLINIPLFTAMAWAMGVTYLVYQRLTLLTAFILSLDRKSTRLNSSHVKISYAVFCLKKKKNKTLL